MIEPIEQIFGEKLYMHQFKINAKAAFTGDVWQWHQDYGTWKRDDGMPEPRAMNIAIFLDEVMPINGPLMLVPKSQHAGDLKASHDLETTSYPLWTLDEETVTKLVKEGGIVAPTGKAGGMLMFHGNLVHGSAGNITPYPRKIVYLTLNAVSNYIPSPWYATYRDFATPQTGTIWLSAILRYADDAGVSWDHVMLYLKQEASGGDVDGVGIHDGHAFLMYRTGSNYDATGPQAYAGTEVYLLLVKVEMNYSGTLDRVTMWIDPNLSSGEAGLGAGTLMKEGQNALGSSLLGVGVSVGDQTNEGLDAIRVGTTLADVTSESIVPDTTPPAGIEDLAVSASAATSITLTWTAPGGSASRFGRASSR